ncbi:non-homologous end joining protein Ku [Granulicella tundricola]|uniref:Non-homologous end joining protein Ku n=1 Tax=Granulicella tundricola (strain ATCC BAA-1859 / DSM 23138 / MP5ACTX9) TaxID=1198114 RepID=E8X210_GRATM|nr:Ku protein [Granulicella tundricola]ADW69171.1 Ku protein [Granulicella tundricola MP5ACTX9]
MARPYWTGQITISLVSFGVKLFVATEAKGEIHFHQISRSTGERVRQQKVLASAQEARESAPDDAPMAASSMVKKDEIVKGYEYTKGQYVIVEPKELSELRVPSKHTMEVIQFVDAEEIDPEYFEKPYFVVPENDAQAPAFAVVRQALRDEKKIALSKIAFGGREHVVAITPTQDDSLGGMMAYTMRYSEELRDPKEYFRDIKKPAVDEDSLDLAKQLIKRKSAKFDPAKFVDGYEVALKELVQAKIDHAPIPKDEAPAPKKSNVVSLMDALRKSIASPASEDTSDHEAHEEAPAKKKPAAKHAAAPAKGIALVKSGKALKAATKTAKAPKRKSA